MKINIRSITFGINEEDLLIPTLQEKIKDFFQSANATIKNKGIKTRTNRILLPPFNHNEALNLPKTRERVNTISSICENLGIRWFCVPFSTFGQGDLRSVHQIALEIIRRYPSAFINFIVSKDQEINFNGIKVASEFIKSVSHLSSSGFDNFRVGISCNCKPNSPFFPFTYQEGESGFSIALELTGELINLLRDNESLDLNEIRSLIVDNLIEPLKTIDEACKEIETSTSVKYYGIDTSLAPLPSKDNSVAQLLELLGVESFGSNGTLYLTSFLTGILRELIAKSNIRRIGFNGVMFSHLEDSGMGKRNDTRNFSIDSLIAYSSVCGCGLDMVPVPGNSFEEEISSLILDVAGLSCVYDKPLGVRLLPIPMKSENEFTNFNHDFLYNTRIKGVSSYCMRSDFFKNKKYKNT